jgi:hypothetical protein
VSIVALTQYLSIFRILLIIKLFLIPPVARSRHFGMARTWLAALSIVLLPWFASAQDAGDLIKGLQRDVTFSAYSQLSESLEVAHRALSPLANVEITRLSARLRPQAIDLAQEKFSAYVPAQHPPQGYALLVFIPPWQDSHLPPGWRSVLDELGMIFVSAAKSGNEENVIDRRIPLALLGAYNITQRYPVNAARVYVGGFSGGSRVAMRIALAYPDLFHGALLNAGSDPIGGKEALLPPDALFALFQSSTRLAYVTGSEDGWNIQHDMLSRSSMQTWCMFAMHVETMLKVGHEVATAYSLRRSLSALEQGAPVDPQKLSTCRARIANELAAELQHTGQLIDRGQLDDAWRSLTKLDARYGGLAAPESIQLEQRIGPRR